jgi:hypothetical protein
MQPFCAPVDDLKGDYSGIGGRRLSEYAYFQVMGHSTDH